MITLTLVLDLDGRSKAIAVDSLTHGDFTTGAAHIQREYLEPMSEILMHAYQELKHETLPGVREALEERESISKRLARLGMV